MPAQTTKISTEFTRRGQRIIEAVNQGNMPVARERFGDFCAELDSVFEQLQAATGTTTPGGSTGGGTGGGGGGTTPGGTTPDMGYKTHLLVRGTGEQILPGHVVTVINETAYMARADNAARPVHALCIGTATNNRVVVTFGGDNQQAFYAGTLTARGRLYLSVTPGFLTDNPAENPASKTIHQEVGLFHQVITTPLGQSSMARITFTPQDVQNVPTTAL